MANLSIDTPSRHVYIGDGSTRVFPIPTPIEGDDWIRIEINGIHIIDRRQWDIVNNSIIFVTAPEAEATIDVLVASSIEAMTQLGSTSAIDVVAENITNVNLVSQNIEDVVNVSDNLDIVSTGFEEVKIVANNILDVTTNATNINEIITVSSIRDEVVSLNEIKTDISLVASNNDNVTTVANIEPSIINVANNELNITEVANISTDITTVASLDDEMVLIKDNIVDIQNASVNAINSKLDSYIAEAHRLTANSYAVEPENTFVKIYTSNGDGTYTSTNTTDYSALHWERKAGELVTSGIIDDTVPALNRTYSSSKVQSELQTIEGNITTIEGNIDTIVGNITTLEGNITTIEGNITTIEGNITTIEGNITTLEGNITTLEGNIDTVESSVSGLDNNKLSKSGGIMTGAITAVRETKVAMDTNNIDLATGNLFTKTITTATTLTVSNVLGSGNANSFILELTNGGAGVITWWSGMKWAGGTAPTLTASGVDVLGFYSHDGGITWRGMLMAKDSK